MKTILFLLLLLAAAAASAQNIVVDLNPGQSTNWFAGSPYVRIDGATYTTATPARFDREIYAHFPKGNAYLHFKVGSAIVISPRAWHAFTNDLPASAFAAGAIQFKR
jgi:hypothetical protein